MNKELEDYYQGQFDMFSTQGWKDFITDLRAHRDALNNVRDIKSPEDLFKIQGELRYVDQVLIHEEMVELAYKQNKENG
jgi:hypothetical protein